MAAPPWAALIFPASAPVAASPTQTHHKPGLPAQVLKFYAQGMDATLPMFLFLKQIGGSLGVRSALTTRKPELWKSSTM